MSTTKRECGVWAGAVLLFLMVCLPPSSEASTVGLILPRDCSFSSDVKDRFSAHLRADGVMDADVLLQRPGADKVSRLNSMRKFLAIGSDIIVVWGSTSLKEIALEAGKTPIVFIGAWDPMRTGLIADLSRPGRNITGVAGKTSLPYLIDNIIETTGQKGLGVVYYSQILDSLAQYEELVSLAPSKGLNLVVADLSRTPEGDAQSVLQPAPFIYLAHGCAVDSGVYTALAAMNKPAATQNPGVTGGGVVFTLAPDIEETIKVAAGITGRILKGEDPGTIPVARITKISFVINVGEAQRLGLKIPFAVLNRGTEVVR